MGFDECSFSDFTLRLINPDGSYGEEIKLENFDDITHFLDLDDNTNVKPYAISKCLFEPIALTCTLMITHNKKSRKTFKKWLMSKGFNRDLAEWFCRVVKSFKGKQSYQSLYLNGLFTSTPQGLVNILFDTLFPIPDLTYTNNKETEK